jgi:hypothetical protein
MPKKASIDIEKLKLKKFGRFASVGIPGDLDIGVKDNAADPEVVFYYVASEADVSAFVSYCWSLALPEDNRVIMIFKKGNTAFGRDQVAGPFKAGTYNGFKPKAPMLCALSDEYSAFVLMKI